LNIYKFHLKLDSGGGGAKNTQKGKIGINRSLFEQQAYDCWHLYEYLYQIYQYKNNKYKNLHIKYKNLVLNKYIILSFLFKIFKINSFLELGSSVFETIDGLEFVNKNIFRFKCNLKKVNFYGIEKSSFFKFIGNLTHPEYKIINLSLKNLKKVELIYDRLVSSYAFSDERTLSNFINKSDIAFMNIACFKNFNSNNKNLRISGTNGYNYTLFDLQKIKLKKNMNGYYLFGKKNPNYNQVIFNRKKKIFLRLDGFFLFCSEKKFKKFRTELIKEKNKFFSKLLDFNNFKNIKNLSDNDYYLFRC
jgi:hypothetical protein